MSFISLQYDDYHPRAYQVVPQKLSKEYNIKPMHKIITKQELPVISFPERYDKLNKIYPLSKRKNNDIFFVKKDNFEIPIGITATSSFNYWKDSNIDIFLPFRFFQNKSNFNGFCVGFYLRSKVTPKFNSLIKEFLKTISTNMNILFYGEHPYEAFNTNQNDTLLNFNWEHTTDANIFYNNISHYVYQRPEIQETFCNSLYEAFLSSIDIIIIEDSNEYNPGVDEILEHINYTSTQHLNEDIFNLPKNKNDIDSNILHPKNYQNIKKYLIQDYSNFINYLQNLQKKQIKSLPEYIQKINDYSKN